MDVGRLGGLEARYSWLRRLSQCYLESQHKYEGKRRRGLGVRGPNVRGGFRGVEVVRAQTGVSVPRKQRVGAVEIRISLRCPLRGVNLGGWVMALS